MSLRLRMGDNFLTAESQSLSAQVARLREGMLKSRTLEVPHDKVRRVPPIPCVEIRLVTPVSRAKVLLISTYVKEKLKRK